MNEESILDPQPYKITIEFSGIILPENMSTEYLRLEKFYRKDKLTLADLDEIIATNRDYAISNLIFDLEKGLFVEIVG